MHQQFASTILFAPPANPIGVVSLPRPGAVAGPFFSSSEPFGASEAYDGLSL